MISSLFLTRMYRGVDGKPGEGKRRERRGGVTGDAAGRTCVQMLDGGVKERTMDRDGETKRPRDWEVEREPPKARISISYIIKYRPGGASQRELTSALIC